MTLLTRTQAEDFLFDEVALLDDWKLLEWASLFTDDGRYLVPATDDPDGEPETSLYLIYDDRHRLGERAKRLLNRSAHAEFPHSRTCHMVSNVRVTATEEGVARVHCNFMVHRSKGPINDEYVGRSVYDLVRNSEGALRIKQKKATLNVQMLRPQGKVSIIL